MEIYIYKDDPENPLKIKASMNEIVDGDLLFKEDITHFISDIKENFSYYKVFDLIRHIYSQLYTKLQCTVHEVLINKNTCEFLIKSKKNDDYLLKIFDLSVNRHSSFNDDFELAVNLREFDNSIETRYMNYKILL